MDLIVLVMGDPWTPDLPDGTTVRPGLARLIVMTALTWSLLFGPR
ncbi:hypothetical protein [Nonomuraea insulae]|uniref:Uncharacterized protein n=1 Tax=Nonomuraea insulae TaxID=1616787 RepID=A0ABW1D774_9ACTN